MCILKRGLLRNITSIKRGKGAGEDTEANTNKISPVFPHMQISDLKVYLRDIPVWFRGEKKIRLGEGIGRREDMDEVKEHIRVKMSQSNPLLCMLTLKNSSKRD